MSLRTFVIVLLIAGAWVPSALAQSGPQAWQRSYELEALGSYDDALTSLYAVPTAQRGYTWELRRGWLLYLDAEHDAAVQAYQQAVRLEPTAVEPRLGLLLPLLADLRWVDAVTAAHGVLALDADNALAMGRLAWAQYNLGRYDEALDSYQLALASFPSDVDLRSGLGWCELQLGRSDGARRAFEAVLAIAPQHASAMAGLAAIEETS
jgi:tetratricopeptide (TPR) repeat protein